MKPTGQLALIGALLVLGFLVLRWQQQRKSLPALPAPTTVTQVPLPKTLTREVAKFQPPLAAASSTPQAVRPEPVKPEPAPIPVALPLSLSVEMPKAAPAPLPHTAPYGRLIPCETIIAVDSNRLETPVIGLVTEDVWHDGQLVIPAGAEVHGQAAIDRTRERLAVQGQWHLVWRTPDRDNGSELVVQGLALDREYDGTNGRWGENDGSAGLRGQIVKTDDERELKLFAASFLGGATAALQDTRTTAGLVGESAVPLTTARNAVLAGAGAVLREYTQAMREAISRDGFFLRVPAGKPFYLYVTQTLDLGQVRRATATPSHL